MIKKSTYIRSFTDKQFKQLQEIEKKQGFKTVPDILFFSLDQYLKQVKEIEELKKTIASQKEEIYQLKSIIDSYKTAIKKIHELSDYFKKAKK